MCGIIGVYDHRHAAYLAYLGMERLQHRGEESAGIVSSDGNDLHSRLGMGLVRDNFRKSDFFALKGNGHTGGANLPGDAAIGHTRYSTTGDSNIANIQPLISKTKYGKVALAHNGNLVNYKTLYDKLEQEGSRFNTTTDSEMFLELIARSSAKTLENAIVDALGKVDGSFSLVMMTKDAMYAVRDPHGFKPLSLGCRDGAIVVASETAAFDIMGGKPERDIKPGELIIVNNETIKEFPHYVSRQYATGKVEPSLCMFEHVYFARPDSRINDSAIALVRERMGELLAEEHPVDADIVTPIPDSGIYAAVGYSHKSGIRYRPAFVRTHQSGRSFIKPSDDIRLEQIDIKLNLIPQIVKDKRVIVVDDSIVRGNTSRMRVTQIREAGAKEVHMRVSCSPHLNPCYYGIDFPSKEELVATGKSLDDIRQSIGADTLGYLSIDSMRKATEGVSQGHCMACWTGKYPTKLTDLENGLVATTKKC